MGTAETIMRDSQVSSKVPCCVMMHKEVYAVSLRYAVQTKPAVCAVVNSIAMQKSVAHMYV